MKRKTILKRFIACFMMCVLLASSVAGFTVTSSALDDEYLIYTPPTGCVYYVDSASALKNALRKCKDNDNIMFTNSITCIGDLKIDKSVTLDFNYYSLSFIESTNGLVISGNADVDLSCGDIYASENSNAAISVNSGNLNLKYMNVFGGEGSGHWGCYGNALYCKSASNNVFVHCCRFEGGNGYRKGIFNPSRVGKAIYGVGILYVGLIGYTAIDGVCR